jgi:Fur family ferric uptake transcriptional regulator
MNNLIEQFHKRLNAKEYKFTPQRQIILEIMLKNKNRHLSVEEVYGLVKQVDPELGLATVYRTLDLFADLNILQKINFGDGKSRYEINNEDEHHHHHLICIKCGKVEEFEDDLLETLETVIHKKNNFKIIDHEVKFFGYCQDCK